MKALQKFGGFAALYMAAAYLMGIIIFHRYSGLHQHNRFSSKGRPECRQQMVFFSTNLLMYVFFGFFLIVLSLALYDRLKLARLHDAGGNRYWDHLGWLADRQRHGRECRARTRSSRCMPQTQPRLR
jgi:hypothetical protein